MTVRQLLQGDDKQHITAVREGLPFEAFIALRDALELSTEELAQLLSIPRRTLTKRQKEGVFKPGESNAVSRVARIYRETVSFFGGGVSDDVGNHADALRWLKTPLPALGGTPLSLLDTDPGADAVSVLLRQLAWGLYP